MNTTKTHRRQIRVVCIPMVLTMLQYITKKAPLKNAINPPNPQNSLYLLHLLLVQNTELKISLQFFCLIHFYLKDNYNIVLISALYQHESAIYICLLSLEHPSKLPPHPTLLGCHRTFLKFQITNI